jgi:hypothetical protein
MATFAVIDNNIVINTIVVDTKETAEEATGKICIEYTEENPAGIGWSWNQDLGFERPPMPETPISEDTVNTEE